MHITDFLTPERIACGVSSASKKRVLEQLSELIAKDDCPLAPREVFDSLLSRERLGSTGFGHGVAIPHGRVANCSHTTAAFIKLTEGIDFDATDNRPVDLLFALLVPENSTEEHLQLLSTLAEMFSDEKLLGELREAKSSENVLELLANWDARH